MANSSILSLVGLAKKAGRLEIGEEPVGASARARQARLILVASDAADNSRRRASHFAEAGKIPWVDLPFSKSELGRIVGRSSCAMSAVTDAGFAAAIADKLSALDAERYGQVAAALDEKAKRVFQRQQEQRRHEKKLREGAKKPWSPPPVSVKKPEPIQAVPKAAPARPRGKIRLKGKLPPPPEQKT